MAGAKRIISGKLAQSKSKGKAFSAEQARALSPEEILKVKGNEDVAKKSK